MANNDVLFETGTPITWKNSGGTYAISLASLGAAACRQGAKGDLGAKRAVRWACRVQINMDVAPVNLAPVTIYWSSSPSATAGTDNTGGASGTDAAYTGPAGGLLNALQQMQLVGVMPMTNDADGVVQIAEFVWYPTQRYGMPVVQNGTAQAFEGDEDTHLITIYPLNEEVS